MSTTARLQQMYERREEEKKVFSDWIKKFDAAPEEELDKLPFDTILNSHVIVVIHPFKYTGTILVPDIAERQPTKGTVVDLSRDVEDSLGLEVGDHVLYSQFAGYLLRFEGAPLMRCLGAMEVLAKLKKGSPEISLE